VVQVVAGQGLSSEEANLSVGLLGAALDHVLPWRVCLGLALSAKLIGPELKVGDIGLAPLVCQGVVSAPAGSNPAVVTARVFSLGVVAHGDGCLATGLSRYWARAVEAEDVWSLASVV
jgi:hypothetical protein